MGPGSAIGHETAVGPGNLRESPSSEAGLQWCFEPVPEDGPGRLQAPLAVASSTRRRILSGWCPRSAAKEVLLDWRSLMDVIHERCAGLDIHKKTVVACVLRSLPGGVPERQVRTFGTMTAELEQLREWLIEWSDVELGHGAHPFRLAGTLADPALPPRPGSTSAIRRAG